MKDEELLRGLREAARRHDGAPTGTPLDASLDEAFVARMAARVVIAPKRKRKRVWLLLSPVALAAAVLLWLSTSSQRGPMAALPPYEMTVSGGSDSVRGAPAQTGTVNARVGTSLELLLRPTGDVVGRLEAHAFLVNGDASRELPDPRGISPTGSIALTVNLTAAARDAHDLTLAIVVSRAGGRFDAASLAAGHLPPPAGVRVERVAVHVVE